MASADAFNAFEAAAWETKPVAYGDFFGEITPRVVEPLLDAAGVGPEVRMLDVASGPGYAAGQAASRGASVVGVDIAEAMVSAARERYPQIEFRHGDAEALAFPDGSFDAVVGNFVLHHLGHPEQAAGEFARVLAPGGRLALTAWDLPTRARFLGVLLDAVAEAGASPPSDIPAGPPFFRFSEDEELVRLLSGPGLGDVETTRISFTHVASSGDELWNGLLAGTVRTAPIVLGQTDEVQLRIRAAFERLVKPYEAGGHLELPVSVNLASARRRES